MPTPPVSLRLWPGDVARSDRATYRIVCVYEDSPRVLVYFAADVGPEPELFEGEGDGLTLVARPRGLHFVSCDGAWTLRCTDLDAIIAVDTSAARHVIIAGEPATPARKPGRE